MRLFWGEIMLYIVHLKVRYSMAHQLKVRSSMAHQAWDGIVLPGKVKTRRGMRTGWHWQWPAYFDDDKPAGIEPKSWGSWKGWSAPKWLEKPPREDWVCACRRPPTPCCCQQLLPTTSCLPGELGKCISVAPWPHVEFKASPGSLRIQWPFNCCNISPRLSWHWSILKHLPWNSEYFRAHGALRQCSQGHGDPFTGEAASLSSMSILEVLLKPKRLVFERCWKCISIILSMYCLVYSNIWYTYVYRYIYI